MKKISVFSILVSMLINSSAYGQTTIIKRQTTRICSSCRQIKPLSDFNASAKTCISCIHKANEEKRIEREKEEELEAKQRNETIDQIKSEKARKDSLALQEKRDVENGKLLILNESDRTVNYSSSRKEFHTDIGHFTLKIDTMEMYIGGTSVKHVIVPERVKAENRIYPIKLEGGGGAYRGELISLTIPSSIKLIPEKAFHDSPKLLKVDLPPSLEYIGKEAFSKCVSIDSIQLREPLNYLGSEAFSGCESLKFIQLPKSLKVIGSKAFAGCNSLEAIEIPSSVQEIGYDLFSKCKSLKIVIFNGSSEKLSRTFSDCRSLESIIFHSKSQISRLYQTFSGCWNLKQIILPGNIIEIDKETFVNCRDLSSIVIPPSVQKIGYHAFAWCKNLSSVTVHAGIKVNPGSFVGCDSLRNITVIQSDGTIKSITASKSNFKNEKASEFGGTKAIE